MQGEIKGEQECADKDGQEEGASQDQQPVFIQKGQIVEYQCRRGQQCQGRNCIDAGAVEAADQAAPPHLPRGVEAIRQLQARLQRLSPVRVGRSKKFDFFRKAELLKSVKILPIRANPCPISISPPKRAQPRR